MPKLLQPAKKQTAYAKIGIYGEAGSGKTFTACLIARGLAKMRKSKKPVSFLDTETGSDYEIDRFKKEGFDLLIARTRAFKNLLAVTIEAQEVSDVFLVDSLSHFWMELVKAWATKLNRDHGRLWMQDYQVVKAEWRAFTDLYLLSHLDLIVCGRAGSVYEYVKSEETGKMTYVEVGTRMKTEKEMGYEPSLLIEMELVQDVKKNKWVHRAWIVKDRTDTISGKYFDNPTFEDFLPALSFIDTTGKAKQEVLDTESNSVDIFGDTDWSRAEYDKQKQIAIEEIEALFKVNFDSRTNKGREEGLNYMQSVFGTRSWVKVKDMKLETLREKLTQMKAEFEPSEEAPEPEPPEQTRDIITDIEQQAWDAMMNAISKTRRKAVEACTPMMNKSLQERFELVKQHGGLMEACDALSQAPEKKEKE